MKIKHFIVLFIILVLITQPVSAGFWDWIIGGVTGEGVEEPVEPEPEPVEPEPGPVEPEPEPEPVPLEEPEEPELPAPPEPVPPEEPVPPTEPEPVPPEEPVPPTEPEPVPPEEPPPDEPVPPEDECPPLKVSRPSCPDGETLCPQRTDEKGCGVWDCDACEKPPEEICPPIPTNQWCYEGHHCPKKRDEKGCIVWDCDACEKPPEDDCPPIPITMTCGADYCEGKSLSECVCPSKKDENGCNVFDCDSCETIPDNCRKIILENGVEVIECEKDCQGIPKGIIKKCEESGGKVIERTDHKGCQFIECEYGIDGDGKCPAPESLEARKRACLNQGLEPMIVRKGECDTIKCRRAEPEQRCAEDVEVKKKIKEECMESGGEVVKHFDNRGCPVTVCIYPEEECHKDVPQEAYENCEMEEGDLMIKRDSQGCLMFVDCVKRGKREVEYEEIEDMPSAATLLAIALKIEILKIDFDKLAAKVRAIAEYYEGTGDKAEAARFRKVAGLFSAAMDKIEEIKIKFRENAREMTKEDLRELKYDLKYVSEVIMQDALYIILGGEIEIEGTTTPVEGGYPDCGSNNRCWEEAVRLCEPVVFKPKDGPNLIAKIHGLDNELCMIEANGEGHSMLCKVPNYATINTDGPEILEYCKGSMVEWIKSGQKPDRIEKPKKPGKCVDLCGDGICQRKVPLADGYPCQESPGLCPKDCRATPTEFELCTEEDEQKWKVCQNEGGDPQSGPSKYGNCEIYTHCEIPRCMSTVEECNKYTDSAIKNDCYIIIADNTGDSSVCVKITEPDREDKCYAKAATTSKDESVCEKIGDEDIKENCYGNIEEGYYEGKREMIRRPEVEGEVVFTEDFEEGTENWHSYSAHDAWISTGWGTTVEEGNTVLKGTGHNWIDLDDRGSISYNGMEWTNYIFKARFKIIKGSMHFNYRLHKQCGFRRYYVGVSNDGMYLTRSTPPGHVTLVDDVKIQLDDNWHNFKMVGYGNILNIYIDDELLIEYKDVGTPALPGGVAFETLGGAEFLVDDVEIRISGEKDVIGGVSND